MECAVLCELNLSGVPVMQWVISIKEKEYEEREGYTITVILPTSVPYSADRFYR